MLSDTDRADAADGAAYTTHVKPADEGQGRSSEGSSC